ARAARHRGLRPPRRHRRDLRAAQAGRGQRLRARAAARAGRDLLAPRRPGPARLSPGAVCGSLPGVRTPAVLLFLLAAAAAAQDAVEPELAWSFELLDGAPRRVR